MGKYLAVAELGVLLTRSSSLWRASFECMGFKLRSSRGSCIALAARRKLQSKPTDEQFRTPIDGRTAS